MTTTSRFSHLRSTNAYGVANECRRGLVRGMGYTEEEFERPIIAVVNSWNEYNPGGGRTAVRTHDLRGLRRHGPEESALHRTAQPQQYCR